jgi:hypothetical protein
MSDLILNKVRTSNPQSSNFKHSDWWIIAFTGTLNPLAFSPGKMVRVVPQYFGGGSVVYSQSGAGASYGIGYALDVSNRTYSPGSFGSLSIAVACNISNNTPASPAPLVGNTFGNAAQAYSYDIYIDSAGLIHFTVHTDVDITTSISKGEHTFALSVVGKAVTAIVDGKVVGTATTQFTDYTSGLLNLGKYSGNTKAGVAYGTQVGVLSHKLTMLSNKKIPVVELLELTKDPWQVFTSERRILSFDSVVAGGGTVDLIGANSTSLCDSLSSNVSQIHGLSCVAASCDSVNPNVSISQVHVLAGSSSSSTTTCPTVSISQGALSLSALNTVCDSTSSNVQIRQVHSLASSSCSSSITSTNAQVIQTHVLVGSNTTTISTSANATANQIHSLATSGNSSTSTSSNEQLTQAHVLQGSSCVGNSTSSSITVSQGLVISLTGTNCVTESNCSTSQLSQAHSLTTSSSNMTSESANTSISVTGVVNLIASACNIACEVVSTQISQVIELSAAISQILTNSSSGAIFLPDGYVPSLTRTNSVVGEVRLVSLPIENRRFTL